MPKLEPKDTYISTYSVRKGKEREKKKRKKKPRKNKQPEYICMCPKLET
jgi:hypothetical protein